MKKSFAFISYSRMDVQVATYLLDRIEKYVYPKEYVQEENQPEDPERVRPIFLDLADLSVQARTFTDEIKEHLENARYLIVICSPSSAKSPFVKLEIDHFLQTHDGNADLIIPIYVDNIFSGMHPAIDKISSSRNCPIYVTGKGDAGHLGRKYCFYHLLEFLLKVDFSILFNRYEEYKKRRQKRRRRFWTIFISIVIASLSFALYQQYQATKTEHDLAQFEKETFPYSLVVGYVDNFLSPTLSALKDSLSPQEPHIICMMPDSYFKIKEENRKNYFRQRIEELNVRFGFKNFEPRDVKIKSRRRAASIVQMNFDNIQTPVYYDFVSTVKAIQSVVDYKFDPQRHKIKIDTTEMSRDLMVREYSEKFITQSKGRLGKDSCYVHFVFTSEQLFSVLEEIQKRERQQK